MKFKEVGFRAFYHQFCAVKLTAQLKEAIKEFPAADSANYALVYGYIDRDAGLTLEILAAAKKGKNGFGFADPATDIRSFIRIESVAEAEFYYFSDEDGSLKKRYAEKIAALDTYAVSEEIEKTREMGFLDSCRDATYPDDIMVRLIKDGLQPEGCWVRISGLGEHWFMGRLLNEPDQMFGYHEGEEIAFFVEETEDKQVFCYSDMNPSVKLKPEDLEDGSMLKNAIAAFEAERTQEHFIDIMEILRDSFIWIPCNAVIGQSDQKQLEQIIKDAGDDLQSLIGKELSYEEGVRMIPDILQSGDDFFFPVFISCEDMGEYGDHFSKVEKHFLEAIALAKNNEKNVKGIVINAFSEPFVVDAGLFDLIEGMKSRIVE